MFFNGMLLSTSPRGWDVSTASYDSKSYSISSQDAGNIGGFFFKDTGLSMYAVGSSEGKIFQYTLSTSWDVSTSSYASKSLTVSSQDSSPKGLFFKSDGSALYIVGTANDTIYQYSLSTAWDVSTGSYASKSKSVNAEDTAPQGLFFKSDGTKMFVIGSTNDTVYQYSLSTAWDVSSASYDSKSYTISSQDNGPQGVFFKSDGTKMYILGITNDTVYQYSLSTAWDVSTASYDSKSKAVGSQDGLPRALFFKSDGKKMYFSGTDNISVYQYSLS